MLQDLSGVVDHIIDDLLGGENLVYLSSDATGEPRPGIEGILGVALEVFFDGEDTSLEESFGFGLTVILPDKTNEKQINTLNQTAAFPERGEFPTYQSST